MKSLAVPTSLQNCGVRLNRCRGVAAPLLRHATQNRAAHSNAPATARNGLCRPVTCAVKTGYMTTEVSRWVEACDFWGVVERYLTTHAVFSQQHRYPLHTPQSGGSVPYR